MPGFKNDVVFAKNADFTSSNNLSPSESNGLATNGQLWVGTTSVNAGGSHVNVGTITSPDNSITIGYSSPNITAIVNTSVVKDLHASPFIVSTAGLSNGANYTSIQAACNDANSVGGGIVLVQPGSYTENLTLYNGVHIMGLQLADAGGGVIITGIHTPPASGGFVFRNVRLISATHILSSNAAGSTHIVIADTEIFVTNGYTFNLPNWTGKLESFDVNGAVGTNDGYVNNTGGSTVAIFNCSVGAGSANTMTVSGSFFSDGASVYCPVNFVTGANLFADYVTFGKPVTLSNNSTGYLRNCTFTGGASAAITMSSSAAVNISHAVVDSTNVPAITGAGAGTLTYSDIAFVNSSITSGASNQSYNYVDAGKHVARGQPCFSAHLGSNVTAVTGDGTAYTIINDVELYDLNSNYNPATGIFTAPIGGKYFFVAGSYIKNNSTSIALAISLVATGASFANNYNTTGAGLNGQTSCFISGIISMAAGDTCKVVQTNSAGIKDNDISNTSFSGSGNATFFSGYLIC